MRVDAGDFLRQMTGAYWDMDFEFFLHVFELKKSILPSSVALYMQDVGF